ncbi:hypothetical protein AN3865.2 [Aspergillus nidulans FGSC A4]|nr:hypothetical protein AN3865.2 [Aspergillus nidulans FGSC A4]|eukprot:XP_661469.1 hypothetical protein AN3865.2 [Aspergillus nidulans FGSC A4]
MASLRGGSRALSWANQLLSRQRLSSKCASQRVAPPATAYSLRQYATTAKEASKPYYVTTPIFYVNAAPHVGHLYTMVLADILKRWRTLTGDNEAQLLTGTDEHGMKGLLGEIVTYAEQEMLQHRGYIYTSKHEGWYSVSDETFYPQSQVNLSLDPATGRKRMVSTETGKEVEWSSETNYHFRLSAFQDRLLELYKTDFITPTHYTEQVVKSVASGLSDLSISRPVERLTWGIPVPNDNTQTIYVWLDALVNYLTKAGYPFPPGEGSRLGWPADVHVVGKDIVRFHCVYWPAFLMALDLPLPRNVLVHAHWTMNREKMSKSTGNVVNPFFAIDRFGMDTMRFFLAHRGGLASDSDYDNRYIIRDYKKYLQQGLGNIAHRTIGCAKGKLRDYIINATSGNSPATADDQAYQKTLEQLSHKVAKCMEALDPRAALEEIVEVILLTNKYFHNSEPWQNPEEKQRVIFNAAESMRIMGILLQPFMPNKAKKLLDILKVDPSKRDLSDAGYARDSTYGEDVKKKILFPPLALEN